MEASLLIVFAAAVAAMLALQEWSARRLRKQLKASLELLAMVCQNVTLLNIRAGLVDEEGNPLPPDATQDGNTTRH